MEEDGSVLEIAGAVRPDCFAADDRVAEPVVRRSVATYRIEGLSH
jgi:hypothetical protein